MYDVEFPRQTRVVEDIDDVLASVAASDAPQHHRGHPLRPHADLSDGLRVIGLRLGAPLSARGDCRRRRRGWRWHAMWLCRPVTLQRCHLHVSDLQVVWFVLRRRRQHAPLLSRLLLDLLPGVGVEVEGCVPMITTGGVILGDALGLHHAVVALVAVVDHRVHPIVDLGPAQQPWGRHRSSAHTACVVLVGGRNRHALRRIGPGEQRSVRGLAHVRADGLAERWVWNLVHRDLVVRLVWLRCRCSRGVGRSIDREKVVQAASSRGPTQRALSYARCFEAPGRIARIKGPKSERHATRQAPKQFSNNKR
mmetsp:Transcript_938/g.2378  ORF Transcript_938/g.2378 Transcript_938/m.2378 type:complete len:308 (+) Transcript_938:575-1498(+)